MNNVRIALAVAGFVTAAPLFGCGSDGPERLLDDRARALAELTEGVFAREIRTLVPAPAHVFAGNERAEWIHRDTHVTRDGVEAHWLGASAPLAHAARGKTDAASAYAVGEGLPEEARSYLAGAAAFAHGDSASAVRRFADVLALPPLQRTHYALWAQFMLGRSYADSDIRLAQRAFAGVREQVMAGVQDPLGLALDSYGEQARLLLRSGDVSGSVRLYAEQAVQGSQFGTGSLLRVATRVLGEPADLDKAVRDPLVRRLLAIYLRTRGEGADNHAAFLDAIERQGIGEVEDADQLAAAAYRYGRYDLAGRFAARSHTGLAAWVRAKLSLRAGNLDAAANAYAEAARAFPRHAIAPEDATGAASAADDSCRAQAEAGVLALARSEYTQAMEHLYDAPYYWQDALFVAERVLTLDELHQFAQIHAAAPDPSPAQGASTDAHDDSMVSPLSSRLRYLLARRLLREGRWDEALSWFDDPALHVKAQAYVEARRAAERGGSVERAEGWHRAAKLAREDGMELIGYEFGPNVIWTGGYGVPFGYSDLLPASSFWATQLPFAMVPRADERARVEASNAQPARRYHYRYVAADFAARAADLVPARSQAYAALLCEATGFVLNDDRKLAENYWRRYVSKGAHVPWAADFGRHCQTPDFPAAAKRLRAERIAAIRHAVRHAAPFAAGGIAAIALALAWRRRRRRSSSAST